MLNIEKYKDEIEENYYRWLEVRPIGERYDLGGAIFEVYDRLSNYEGDADDVIEWLCEEYKEPILDDKEREYLGNIVKPFKENAKVTIELKEIFIEYDRYQYITVTVDGNNFCESFNLPKFDSGKMYKNMKLYHEYTLKELGL